jgi:hypothetical protein
VKALLGLALLALSACAAGAATVRPAASTDFGGASEAAADVEVVRDGEGWTADFRFRSSAPVWAFTRSPLARESNRPWRPESWTVLTPGVRLERLGWYDAFVADKGVVPERVRIRFTPFGKDIETSYDPALIFTDGSIALYGEQFKAFPLPSRSKARALPIDPSAIEGTGTPTRVTFRDANGRILHAGQRLPSVTLDDPDTYVLFGPATPLVSETMATVIDPGLPAWLRTFLLDSTPKMLAYFADALGPPPGVKPTVMASWSGPTPGMVSMSGSVLPGMVVMTFEGAGVAAERPGMRHQTRWFIAHESAHFWLGQAVAYESPRDSWITEGGADLLAIRAVSATDPGYDARAELQRALDECVKLAGRPIASAQERGEYRAYYACGAIFALVAESASGRPFARWLRPLIEANRADGVLSRGEWLAALDASSGDRRLGRDMARLLDRGASDPKAALAALLTRAGVPFGRAPDGALRLS